MKRSAFRVMVRLIGLIRPLIGVMILAVLTGVAGFLAANALIILATRGVLDVLGMPGILSLTGIIVFLVICGVLRGVLRYIEQLCNHYIAFKLLALIRHKIFAKLRVLSPAKLEGKEKGNLITVITGDIELLEVFYAHTISPIAIAFLTSCIMTGYIGHYDRISGVIAAVGYLTVGVVLPVIFSSLGNAEGRRLRDDYGKMNSFFLENIRGILQILQFDRIRERSEALERKTDELEERRRLLQRMQGINAGLTSGVVIAFPVLMYAVNAGRGLAPDVTVLTTVALMASFGPVIALSSLSGNLYHTVACGNRVLDLLEEEPAVRENETGAEPAYDAPVVEHVSFAYGEDPVLKNVTVEFPKYGVVGISGPSGCGKSTLLKLMMRFWDRDAGEMRIGETDLKEIRTQHLRRLMGCVSQETVIFNDSMANNIAIGKPDATPEEIRAAARKASIDDFIMSLPEGYNTMAGEGGANLSGGERQRIGLARAFLHDAPILMLDEPTSNIDSLNEGIILRSITEHKDGKLILLVSHRKSTMGVCDTVYDFLKENAVTAAGVDGETA